MHWLNTLIPFQRLRAVRVGLCLLSLLLSAWWAQPFSQPSRAQQGCATPSFSAATQTPTGQNPQGLATGDFNLDGRLDLAVVNRNNNSVSILLNNGNGGFTTQTLNVTQSPLGLAAGDFNRDNRLDLIVSSEAGQPALLLNNGTGSFAVSATVTGNGPTLALAVGDFNQDGKLDLVTGGANVTVLTGNGAGTLNTPTAYETSASVRAVAVADFNSDGKPDVAALLSSGDSFAILVNDGTGGLLPPAYYTTGLAGAVALTVGEFNSDGFADLAVANQTGNRVSVQLNSGAGEFNQAQNFGTASTPDAIAAGDFNADGKADLAVSLATAEISVHLGNDTGQFGDGFRYAIAGRSAALITTDLNGDGRMDLATANAATNNLSVLLNACPAPPINTPPTIAASTNLTRQQGAPPSTDTLATVSDAQTSTSNLLVFAQSVPAGLTLSNLTNNRGTISASLNAACNAPLGTLTIKLLAIDESGLSTTADIPVSITANTPPTLGAYPNATANTGAGASVQPSQPPNDNVTVTTVTVAASAGFTGNLSVNPTTGVVSILNAQPAGTHTITVTARDNCGATATQSFTLTVAATSCVNTRPGLISWYRGENSATDFQNLNNPSASAGVSFAPGRVGQALNFNGSSEVVIPNSASLNFQQFTFEGWVYPTLLDGTVEMVLNKEDEPFTTYHYEVGLAGTASSGIPTGTLLIALNGLGGLPNDFNGFVNAGGVLPLNTWTHIAFTFDGTTLRSYLNGTPARTVANLTGSLITSTGPLKLGSRADTLINQDPRNRFNGLLDELSLYNRALSAQELQAIYSTGSAGKCTSFVNTAPTIVAGTALTLQQGSAAALTQLATVSDKESEAGELTVTVTNAPAGLVFSNLTNTNGAITANVVIGCAVPVGAAVVAVRVSDGALSSTANFTVNVTANRAPLLGDYGSPGTLRPGEDALITPSFAPSDNGTITSLLATVAGDFTGSISVNPATGVVTLSNVRPAGNYTATVTATDNCNAVTTVSFPFTVTKLATTVTLAGGGGPYAQGLQAELIATVTSTTATALPPSGTVTFFDGTTALGTAAVGSNGVARLQTAALIPGARALTATYSGDTLFLAATSAPLGLTVSFAVANVSAASYRGETLSPEQIVAAFGARLATTRATATTLPLPTTLAGTAVRILDSANKEWLAPLFFVAPTQVNYLLPSGVASGSALITVVASDGVTSITRAQIAPVSPGVFTADASGSGVPAAQALRVRADGSQVAETVLRLDTTTNKFVAVPLDLGPATDQVFLILYGTGWRFRTNATAPSATIGGVAAEIGFLGAQPSLVGVDQANLRIPRALIGRGEVEVLLNIDGKAANAVRINVK